MLVTMINPRGGVEEEQLHHLVELVGSISLSPSNDRWAWLLGSSGEFSVHSARTFIDDILLPFVGDVTRWVKVVPIKVNILAWKVCLDKLPTRLNLSLRGIDIPSIICPNCGLAGESCSHLFYSCNLARTLWRKIARWWEIDIPDFSCYEEWIAWFKTTRFSKAQKEMLEGVFYVMWWMIWKFRNQVLFGSSHPRMELLFDDIEDKVRQQEIMNLAIKYGNASTAKDDMRKGYEECNDIPLKKRALIDTFLEETSDKDYEMHNVLFRKAAKLEKQIINKVVWLQQI
ncbi:RNA-directed DNA polymerase, eukaryota [Tanacetum coccineum]